MKTKIYVVHADRNLYLEIEVNYFKIRKTEHRSNVLEEIERK
jgi:hypothetical protein